MSTGKGGMKGVSPRAQPTDKGGKGLRKSLGKGSHTPSPASSIASTGSLSSRGSYVSPRGPKSPLRRRQRLSIGTEKTSTRIMKRKLSVPAPIKSDEPPAPDRGPSNIRTRLSTGSIQMSGTNTVSAAKEKAEMDQILKQIAKVETIPAGQPSSTGKKRSAATQMPNEPGACPLPKKRKVGRNDGSGQDNRNDYFCWLCHRDGTLVCCELCPRVYHMKCLGLTSDLPQDWVCPECEKIMRAECIDTRSKAMEMLTLDKLCTLLKYALERMEHEGSGPFLSAVDPSTVSYSDYIFYPMDLATLEKNIKRKMYGCTEALLSDAKWILHNCIIYNGAQHKLTSSAKVIVKICKHEMTEIELCPDCYLNSCIRKDVEWFSEPCRKPHTLVWAKLKGYPFWPSKALREEEGQVDVRFFGAHDRSWVPVSQCFLLSKSIPAILQKGKKNAGMDQALEELNKHIQKLIKEFGSFEYAPFRTPYDRNDQYKPMKVNVSPKKLSKYSLQSQRPSANIVRKSAISKTASALKNKYNAIVSLKKVDSTPEKRNLRAENSAVRSAMKIKSNVKDMDIDEKGISECISNSVGNCDTDDDIQKEELINDATDSTGIEKPDGTECKSPVADSKTRQTDKHENETKGALQDTESDIAPDTNRNTVSTTSPAVVIEKPKTAKVRRSSIIEKLAKKIKELSDEPDGSSEVNSTQSQESAGSIGNGDTVNLAEKPKVDDHDNTWKKESILEDKKMVDSQIDKNKSAETNKRVDDNVKEKDEKYETDTEEHSEKENHSVLSSKEGNDENIVSNSEDSSDEESGKSESDEDSTSTSDDGKISPIIEKDVYNNTLERTILNCKAKLGIDKVDSASDISDSSLDHEDEGVEDGVSVSTDTEHATPSVTACVDKSNVDKADDKPNVDATEDKTLIDTVEIPIVDSSDNRKWEQLGQKINEKLENLIGKKIKSKLENLTGSTIAMSTNDQNSGTKVVALEKSEVTDLQNKNSDAVAVDKHTDYEHNKTENGMSAYKSADPPTGVHSSDVHNMTENKTERDVNNSATVLSGSSSCNSDGSKQKSDLVKPVTPMKIIKCGPSSKIELSKTGTDTEGNVVNKDSVSSSKSDAPAWMFVDMETDDDDSDADRLMIDLDADSDSPKPSKFSIKGSDVTNKLLSPLAKGTSPLVIGSKSTMRVGDKTVTSKSPKFGTLTTTSMESVKTVDKATTADCVIMSSPPPSASRSPDGMKSPSEDIIRKQSPRLSPPAGASSIPTTTASTAQQNTAVVVHVPFISSTQMATVSSAVTATTTAPIIETVVTQNSEPGEMATKIADKFSKKLALTIQQTMDEMCREVLETRPPVLAEGGGQQEVELARWEYTTQLTELKHNFQLTINEMKSCWEGEKSRLSKELKATHEKEMQEAVKETKEKQWCANCGKEAIFYCCWNTSYCDYPCQQAHWPNHMNTCLQTNLDKNKSTTTTSQATAVSSTPVTSQTAGGSQGSRVGSLETSPVHADQYQPQRIQNNPSLPAQSPEGITRQTPGYSPIYCMAQTITPPSSIRQSPSQPLPTNIMQMSQFNTALTPASTRSAQSVIMSNTARGVYMQNTQLPLHGLQPHRANLNPAQPVNSRMILPQTLVQQRQNLVYPVHIQQQQQQHLGNTLLFGQTNPQANLMGYGSRPPF